MAKKKDLSDKVKPISIIYRWLGRLGVLLLFLMLVVGIYILILSNSATKNVLSANEQSNFLESQGFGGNKLIIPKIALNEDILTGGGEVLDHGIWHRYPDRGNPQIGGNTILAGHRYVFAWLPQKVVENSRLYNLDKLDLGDKVFINWEGKQYEYDVTERRTVSPNDSQIEAPSQESKLTLYTCTLNGQADGRIVVIAKEHK